MVINPIVGVYIPIIRIPIKGGRSPIPNTRSLDPGTCQGIQFSHTAFPTPSGRCACTTQPTRRDDGSDDIGGSVVAPQETRVIRLEGCTRNPAKLEPVEVGIDDLMLGVLR